MVLVDKFTLYIDTLKRFTPMQFAYWVKNRYLHRFTVKSYPDCTKISFFQLDGRLKTIFCGLKKDPVWHYGVRGKKIAKNNYYQILIQELERGIEQHDFKNLWKRVDPDPEMLNNFQRFYLFDRAFRELGIGNKIKLSIFEQWMLLFDTKKGRAWSGFNCAIRILNWLKILYHINQSNLNNSEINQRAVINRIQQSIFEQALFNYNHIEYHIPGNHVLFQFISLWFVFELWPEWGKQLGDKSVLENKLYEEIRKEFKSNGFHFELSTHYHLQATLFCLLWYDVNIRVYKTDSEEISNILVKALHIIQDILLPDNTLPLAGDNCYPFWHASLEEDIDNVRALADYHFGLDIHEKKNTTREIKEDWLIFRNNQQHVILDIGQIGLPANPGHGHADKLNIIYSDAGQPLFIDPGTFLYSDDNAALKYKKTIHHNTLSVNGNDQACLWGFFRWAWLPSAVSYNFVGCNNSFHAHAQFKGYKHNDPVIHSREIYAKNGRLSIKDQVDGEGCHDIYLNFILHPDIHIRQDNDTILLSNKTDTWHFKFKGTHAIETTIESILVYPAYNLETLSHKIVLSSLQTNFPVALESHIIRH